MTKKGFTLIELLVVISIIGLLSSTILVSLNQTREKARYARAQAEVDQINKALELYIDEKRDLPCAGHYYPGWGGDPSSCFNGDSNFTKFYQKFPSTDPWGQSYVWHWRPGSNEATFLFSFGNSGGDWWPEHNGVCSSRHICKFPPRPPELGR